MIVVKEVSDEPKPSPDESSGVIDPERSSASGVLIRYCHVSSRHVVASATSTSRQSQVRRSGRCGETASEVQC